MAKSVLLVDRDAGLLDAVVEGLKPYEENFSLMTASSGEKALAILSSKPVDLLLTDLNLPDLDGFEFLTKVTDRHPTLPCIASINGNDPEIEERLMKMGVMRILHKPLNIEDIRTCFEEGLKRGPEVGSLVGVSVGGFLQMIEMEQKTCLLEVRGQGGRNGIFYLYEGVLYDAVCGEKRAEEAALLMLTWDQVRLNIKQIPANAKYKRRINSGLMSLILEAARFKDEALADEMANLDDDNTGGRTDKDSGNDDGVLFLKDDESGERDEGPHKMVKEEGRSQMADLKEILKEMADQLDGLIGIGIVGMDGIGVANYNPSGADIEAFDAKFSMIMKLVERSIKDVKGLGEFEENLVQTKNAWVLTHYLTKDYFLGIAVSRESTLGNVRLVSNKYVDKCVRALS